LRWPRSIRSTLTVFTCGEPAMWDRHAVEALKAPCRQERDCRQFGRRGARGGV
jgi:S-adenosylmethionine/arginine decarboxylase-like enzyme